MAVTKTTDSRSFAVEVRKGTDALGNPTYSKKSFSNVSSDATDENIYTVASAISQVLKPEIRNILLVQTDQLNQI